MTKDEAVQKLSKVARISVAYAEDLYDSFFPKPVIPYYIADYLEKVKSEGDLTVVGAVNEAPEGEVSDWLILENVNTFAKAWVNGYEVKKEKRYIVKIKGIAEAYNCLNYNTVQKMYSISTTTELGGVYIIKFTRKQLEEAGFGEVFDNPMFEIEEVE